MTSFTETKDGKRKSVRKFRQIIRVLVLDRAERVRRDKYPHERMPNPIPPSLLL